LIRTKISNSDNSADALQPERDKARQRGLLEGLDDRMLADIGITREQAEREARKPFWRVFDRAERK
jgi:uncharacterized protein YjiS (DUF1127 family)